MAVTVHNSAAQAAAVPDPKHVLHDVAEGVWRVYTGSDMPGGSRSLPILDFRARFTDPELAAIVGSADAGVKVLLLKLTTRTEVDLDDPQVIAGMELLVARGLLTGSRRDAILA